MKRKERKRKVSEDEIQESKDWKKSRLSIYINKTNYRRIGGKEHAVCDDGMCWIHEDTNSASDEPIKHFKNDVPFSTVISIFTIITLMVSIIKKIKNRRDKD